MCPLFLQYTQKADLFLVGDADLETESVWFFGFPVL